jgi:glycosyltransferase involved in cell wall biosynthesis
VKTREQLDELYEESQIVAYPTIDEPWGLVPLEAMAHGRPVIVGTGGPRESVIDGKTGIYVDPFDVKDIAESISKLLSDFELCKYMGDQGRKHVANNYDISRSFKIVDELFSKQKTLS